MTETVDYSVEESIGEVEIRRYPKLILATIKDATDDSAFSILFRYISGSNRPRSEIVMTAPLISQGRNEQIAMTSPVISDDEAFSFVMPEEFTMDTIPEPLDDRIVIAEVPERTLAVTRFSGRASYRDIQKHFDELVAALNGSGLTAKGGPFLMRYNSPFMPGFLRRNEIGVQIDDAPREPPGS